MPSRLGTAVATVATLTFMLTSCAGEDEALPDQDQTLLPISAEGSWGYIDLDGEIVIEPRFERAWDFSDDLALVKSHGRYGFIDRAGRFVVEPRFTDAWHFSGGLAPVELDTSWAYVDRDGRIIADTQYRIQPSTFVEAAYERSPLRLVSSGGRFGFAGDDGEPVIEPRFENAWRFSNGLARVTTNDKWGYIDRSGSFVIQPQFDLAWDFGEGVAKVQVDGQMGYIDREGNSVWPPAP